MNIKRTISIAVVCVLLVTVFSAVMVYAPPPENVGLPTLQDVFVTNEGVAEAVPVELTNTPVPVEVVNSPELQPVQFTKGFYIYSGDSAGGNEEMFEVPAGKLLVIEYVSARALYLHPDDTLSLMLLTTLNGDINPTFLGVFESQGNTWQTLSKEVKVYCDPETFVTVFGNRETQLNDAEIMVSMTGHLVDAS